MASLPGVAPAYAVGIPQVAAGTLQYDLAAVEWQLLSLSFTLDATNAAASRTVFVAALAPNGGVIVESYVAVSVPVGSTGLFSLAPYLNPCDTFTAGGFVYVEDTFPSLVLTTNCRLSVQAVDASDGTAQTDAPLGDGLAWVSDIAGATIPAYDPVYLPVPIVAGGLTAGGAGG